MDKYWISDLFFDRSDNAVGSIVTNGIIYLEFMSLDSIKKEEYSTLVKDGKSDLISMTMLRTSSCFSFRTWHGIIPCTIVCGIMDFCGQGMCQKDQ